MSLHMPLREFLTKLREVPPKVLRARVDCMVSGHQPRFVRNIHGDEIIEMGYARSVWRCSHCQRVWFKPDVHSEARNESN